MAPDPAHIGAPPAAADHQDYLRALASLNRRVNLERTRPSRVQRTDFKLDRMRALLDALGNPQHGLRAVHIAGSKGKGRVAEMLSAALTGCGLAVGTYTSPHLVDVRERIRIRDAEITPDQFAALIARVDPAADAVADAFGQPTWFECLTAAAILHFTDQAVDIAVVETGLGGRLDATNLLQPDLCLITSLQLEHTQILGNTLEAIAAEKAGIFKPGVPADTLPPPPPALATLSRVANDVGTPLEVLGQSIDFQHRFEADHAHGPHSRVSCSLGDVRFEHVPVPLKGEHQAWNCGLVLAALALLAPSGIPTDEQRVCAGLARTRPAGRAERILDRPAVIIDGAHTPESIQALIQAIGAHHRFDSVVFVFGCAADKDIDGMLRRLAHGADKVVFTRPDDFPRAADPRLLLERFQHISPKMAQAADDLPAALHIARNAVSADDLICVTGSFYLAGQAKRYIAQRILNAARPAKP